jgi:hypothetical protein
MARPRSKGSLLALFSLLVCGGIGVGALASSLTSDAIRWRPPAHFPMTEAAPEATDIDQAAAGEAWARSAYAGGLRRCPVLNPEFLAGCEAEIAALSARPEFPPGSYGGPLLITKVEPIAPEEPVEPYEPVADAQPDEWRQASYDPAAEEEAEPAFERTPDNYPAAPPDESDEDEADEISPS